MQTIPLTRDVVIEIVWPNMFDVDRSLGEPRSIEVPLDADGGGSVHKQAYARTQKKGGLGSHGQCVLNPIGYGVAEPLLAVGNDARALGHVHDRGPENGSPDIGTVGDHNLVGHDGHCTPSLCRWVLEAGEDVEAVATGQTEVGCLVYGQAVDVDGEGRPLAPHKGKVGYGDVICPIVDEGYVTCWSRLPHKYGVEREGIGRKTKILLSWMGREIALAARRQNPHQD